MWPIEAIVKTIKQKAVIDEMNGEPGISVPRDRLPASHYRDKNEELKKYYPENPAEDYRE